MLTVRSLKRQRALIIVLLLGTLSLIVIDSLLTQGFVKEKAYQERVTTEQLKSQIQSNLEEHVAALLALKVVYQNFTDINNYDFHQYGQSITSTLNSFERLHYIDPSLTIRQIYPATAENRGLYNYSLKKTPDVVSILNSSKHGSTLSTSKLMGILGHSKNFWTFIPIVRSQPVAASNGHGSSKPVFLGYAVAEVSLDKVLHPLLSQAPGYQLQLIDPDGTALFPQLALNAKGIKDSHVYFSVGSEEKKWLLILHPLQANAQAMFLLMLRLGLWLGGLLIIFLAGKIITSSDKYKAQIEEAHAQFQTIVQASPDGILLLDANLRLLVTNTVIREWLGKTEEELKDKTFFDCFSCCCPTVMNCKEVNRLLCTSDSFSPGLSCGLETYIVNPIVGSNKTLRLNASKITHVRNGHREDGFICILGDISTRKELERVKETYVATLTHDLKTPLLAQQMVLETLVSETPGMINEEQRRLLNGAWESVQDLIDMVNSTLLFYKLEASHVNLHRQPRSIAPLIKDVMQSLKPLAEKRDIRLEIDTAVDLPDASVDVIQLKRVFHNLLSNALYFSRKGSPVRASLRVDREPGLILIEFYNEGKGINPEELPKIFEKYHSTSRKFKQIGSGLGLYITRRIIELHGGKVWATSIPNEDTRFFISLPCIQTISEDAQNVADIDEQRLASGKNTSSTSSSIA